MVEKNNPPAAGTGMEVSLDRLIHQPARLKILAFLSLVDSADFTFLAGRIGLTMGNLSAHISKLEEAGYAAVRKDFVENRPRTMISITENGIQAFEDYRKDMLQLLGK